MLRWLLRSHTALYCDECDVRGAALCCVSCVVWCLIDACCLSLVLVVVISLCLPLCVCVCVFVCCSSRQLADTALLAVQVAFIRR